MLIIYKSGGGVQLFVSNRGVQRDVPRVYRLSSIFESLLLLYNNCDIRNIGALIPAVELQTFLSDYRKITNGHGRKRATSP